MPILFALLAVLAPSAGVQPGPGPHARVTLVAERSSLEAGTENMLGVHFVLEPGWHIYWRNPGDSGAPPLVQWKLPAGYVAEDLLYPAPQRITSGSFANYGYERDVLLLAPIRVPSDAGAGAEISASVRFIVCREVCVPGRAAPSLAMPVGGPAHASRFRALFDATRARVPQRAPAAWTSTAAISADDILVTLTTGRRESGWQFFRLAVGRCRIVRLVPAGDLAVLPARDGNRQRLGRPAVRADRERPAHSSEAVGSTHQRSRAPVVRRGGGGWPRLRRVGARREMKG